MSSPKVYLEELVARKAELSSRLEMMENHLAGRESPLGSWEDYKDVTERDASNLRAELAHIDEEIERVSSGRSADTIANAIRVARIATGEVKEEAGKPSLDTGK